MTVTIRHGDCRDVLRTLPDGSVQLCVTSPPYNIGKAYETVEPLDSYLQFTEEVIEQVDRVLAPGGSICWQTGNFVGSDVTEILPLDMAAYPLFKSRGYKLRNRICWTFGHGQHYKRRFSGRHETVLWFTKGDEFTFNLDAIRVPQKYPGKKHFKGPKKGQLSGNPLGANPGDVWDIPNIKHNHPEKTEHPCQFPEALVRRLIAATTNPGDTVLDPFAGSGTTGAVASQLGRDAILIESDPDYVEIAHRRITSDLFTGGHPVGSNHQPAAKE
jgi:adenine-specific DNA-methyltransferase